MIHVQLVHESTRVCMILNHNLITAAQSGRQQLARDKKNFRVFGPFDKKDFRAFDMFLRFSSLRNLVASCI